MESCSNIHVISSNGDNELFSSDIVMKRLLNISANINGYIINNKEIDHSPIIKQLESQIYDNIQTNEIDELLSSICASLATSDIRYADIAAGIVISNWHKNTLSSFSETMKLLKIKKPDLDEKDKNILSKEFLRIVDKYSHEFDAMIKHERDYLYDYFGFKTLVQSYLLSNKSTNLKTKICERPQHMWLRVAIAIHGENIFKVQESYELMSQKYFTHATPTLFNAGTLTPQLSSCYLIAMEEDSIEGIYNTIKDCALISKYSGGIGLHIHNIRSSGSSIVGTNGTSSGIIPMLRVFNATSKYVNQGGKRNGSVAIYLEPWHPDIMDFLELKKNHGNEEAKARELFYALWVSDLFMKRVKEPNGKWSLFCPNKCPGLSNVYGLEFERLYEHYERLGLASVTMDARTLWTAILDSQMETGTPYLLYKDAVNLKSNQKNLGTIKSSNLCCEIMQYSDPTETAVCNLASVGLPSFIDEVDNIRQFNYDKLHHVVQVITENLNKIIDNNYYPTEKSRLSNLKHRPIGIGVQGLADVFMLMDIPFFSEEAKIINKNIFETMYHAALTKSNQLAITNKNTLFTQYSTVGTQINKFGYWLPIKHAGAYASFSASPASQGILQFDMWDITPSDRYDWAALKSSIMRNGLTNSLLLAPMPTASTSQIFGFNECFEPITSNIYSRRTLAGEFIVPNKYLIREMTAMGLWNEDIKNNIIANKGSVQHLTKELSQHQRDKYKIVWEIPMKHVINMSADRGAFICQSQSLNLWMETPSYNKLTAMHFYSWEKGLKTGMYYLRRKALHQSQQFTIEPVPLTKEANKTHIENNKNIKEDEEDDYVCTVCSS